MAASREASSPSWAFLATAAGGQHRAARASPGAWPVATAAGGSKCTGDDGKAGVEGPGGRGLASGSRSRRSRRQGLEAGRTASSAGPSTTTWALSRVIFEGSNVGTSCQTHSVAAGKLDVSMGSAVLEVHHRDVVVGLDEAPPDTRVSVETNVASLGMKVKTMNVTEGPGGRGLVDVRTKVIAKP